MTARMEQRSRESQTSSPPACHGSDRPSRWKPLSGIADPVAALRHARERSPRADPTPCRKRAVADVNSPKPVGMPKAAGRPALAAVDDPDRIGRRSRCWLGPVCAARAHSMQCSRAGSITSVLPAPGWSHLETGDVDGAARWMQEAAAAHPAWTRRITDWPLSGCGRIGPEARACERRWRSPAALRLWLPHHHSAEWPVARKKFSKGDSCRKVRRSAVNLAARSMRVATAKSTTPRTRGVPREGAGDDPECFVHIADSLTEGRRSRPSRCWRAIRRAPAADTACGAGATSAGRLVEGAPVRVPLALAQLPIGRTAPPSGQGRSLA
jgi:hypothetical protein